MVARVPMFVYHKMYRPLNVDYRIDGLYMNRRLLDITQSYIVDAGRPCPNPQKKMFGI